MAIKTVKVIGDKNQAVVAEDCQVADRFFSRMFGLMGKKELPQGEGMYFPNCQSIHMWFMRIPIDVVFTSQSESGKSQITSIHENVRPWRLLPLLDVKGKDVFELPVGTVQRCQLLIGDQLCIN